MFLPTGNFLPKAGKKNRLDFYELIYKICKKTFYEQPEFRLKNCLLLAADDGATIG